MTRRIKKFRISTICLGLLFLLTTALGLLALPLADSYAVGPEGSEGALKFQQVAAGDDFAVALTYDYQLYAWSLLDKTYTVEGTDGEPTYPNGNNTTGFNSTGNTLGQYYPSVPIKINLASVLKGVWYDPTTAVVNEINAESTGVHQGVYLGHKADDVDYPIQIAATRTSVAFLTSKKLIYVWGRNTSEPIAGSDASSTAQLLLGESGTNLRNAPAMIDYQRSDVAHILLPVGSTAGSAYPTDIHFLSASENNYMAMCTIANNTRNFIWGQRVYNQYPDSYVYAFAKDRLSHGGWVSNSPDTYVQGRAYLGDGNIFYIGNNNALNVTGKNFALTGNETLNVDDEGVATVDGYADHVYVNAGTTDNPTGIDGYTGYGSASGGSPDFAKIADAVVSNIIDETVTPSVTTSYFRVVNSTQAQQVTAPLFEQSDGPELGIGNRSVASLYNSAGGELYNQIDRPVFSAANGYAYWIGENSKLYGVGNDRLTGLGDGTRLSGTTVNTTGLNGESASYVQVVAGKILSGYPIIEGYGASGVRVTNITDKWNENNTLKTAYADGKTMISAVLSANGGVTVFGSYQGTKIGPSSLDTTVLRSAGLNISENGGYNKAVALYGGYGNNLFILSDLGKVYHVTYNGTAFTCKLIDEYTQNVNGTAEYISNWTLNTRRPTITFNNYFDKPTQTVVVSAHVELTGTASMASEPANTRFGTVSYGEGVAAGTLPTVVDKTKSYSGDAYRMILPISQKKVGETGYVNINTYSPDGSLFEEGGSVLDGVDGSLKSVFDKGVEGVDYSRYYANNKDNFGKLQFYWNSDTTTPIPDYAAFRYVDVEYRYNQGAEGEAPTVSMVITPKQSTGANTLIIKYWVGRYDTENNFYKATAPGSNPASVYTFYDFKQTSVSVKISDTQPDLYFTSGQGLRQDTNYNPSTVPLLDPNNPYNNTYSLATMNVSVGFDKVLDELAKLTDYGFTGYNRAATYDKLIANVYAKDTGFPASARIALGSLNYYNNEAATHYNNVYRYLVDDRDGDIISLASTNRSYDNFDVEVYDGDNKMITVFMPFMASSTAYLYEKNEDTETDIDSALLEELRNRFEKRAANGNMLRFDNKYGLTMRVTTANVGTTAVPKLVYGIEFKYSVVTIKAKRSMTSGLTYEPVQGEENVFDVSRPLTNVSTGGTPSYAFEVDLRDAVNNVDMSLNNMAGARRAVEVFTQSSLTFADLGTANPSGIVSVYGAPVNSNGQTLGGIVSDDNTTGAESGKTNMYIYRTIPLSLNVSSQSTYEVNLGNLFNDRSSANNISITYEGQRGDTAWGNLMRSFMGSSEGNAVAITRVTATTLTLEARRAVNNYEFTIEMTRFPLAGYEYSFEFGNAKAETVYLKFKVNVTFDENFFKKQGTQINPPTITEASDFELINRLTVPAELFNGGIAKVTKIASSNNSIVMASWNSEDKTKIRLTPRSSGTARIQYTVEMHGYTITDSFPVTVATLTLMSESVKVVKDEQIYFSELMNYINSFNDLNGVELVIDDNDGLGVPYYFQQTDDTSGRDDADKVWYDIESIPFLSAYMDSSTKKAYMGLKMGSFDSSQTAPVVRVVVRFKGAGNIYRIAFKVEPAAQLLRDTTDNAGLLIQINKGESEISIVNRADDPNAARSAGLVKGEGGAFRIPVDFLVSLMSGTKADQSFEIIAAQAMSSDGALSYGKYIDVAVNNGGSELLITPKYPTEEISSDMCNVQVSVRVKNSSSVTMLNFSVRVNGINTTLERSKYITIILASAIAVFVFLLIIFFIRMGIYWKKRAEQKRIIKKNQTLIKMRDKMHNKTDTVSKEQLVRTKLKMEDPKYARMFNEMRAQKEAQTGVSLDNSIVAQKAETREEISNASKKKKKKGGKRSLEELQAELEAKREAVARMQGGDFGGMSDDMPPMDGAVSVDGSMEQQIIEDVPVFNPDADFGAQGGFDMGSADNMDGNPMDDVVIEPFNNGEEN